MNCFSPRDDGVLSMLHDHSGHGGLLSMTKVLTLLCSWRYLEMLPAVENFPLPVELGSLFASLYETIHC